METPPRDEGDGDMWADAPVEETRGSRREREAKEHRLQMADTLKHMRKAWKEIQRLMREGK